RAGSQSPPQSVRWKWSLFSLCALLAIVAVGVVVDDFGLGGKPWYGFYDSGYAPVAPYTEMFQQIRPGGATDKAGIREGDLIDFRDQPFATRIFLLAQPSPVEPLTMVIIRNGRRFTTTLTASTAYDGGSALKTVSGVLPPLTALWCLGCVLLIATRKSWSLEGGVLAVALTSIGVGTNPNPDFTFPNAAADLVLWTATWLLCFVSVGLIVWLSGRMGTRSTWRAALEWLCYAALTGIVAALFIGDVGFVTLRVDPSVFTWNNPNMYIFAIASMAFVVLTLIVAIASASKLDRSRAAWLLLPIPAAIALSLAAQMLQFSAQTWYENVAAFIYSQGILLLGAFAVTYALVKRRVLDSGFLLSRTLVFGIVSLIVVAAFALLEWVLGLMFAGASHATGLIANAALALVLGVSLSYIQKRVDTFVDAIFFRKRYDDERALRDFSHEAAFVTEREMLLDQAVDKIRSHTDARNAVLFVRDNGSYKAARGFGDVPIEVNENDPAILALKVRHKPFDPHHYASAMRGDLAVPMVARGQLVGVLLCGERANGEGYAPDEIEALSEFAHGVGSALDGLGNGVVHGSSDSTLLGSIDSRLANIERLLGNDRA
ncbi:MAG TPA: GAF domain-containing protein, partial [Candidatus Eremiobacteraceae bacterium]|nr:GAF domain-containing protein [Candidatus Eremiobacteraceae bacterium]